MKLRILNNSNFTLVTHQLYLKSRNYNLKINTDYARSSYIRRKSHLLAELRLLALSCHSSFVSSMSYVPSIKKASDKALASGDVLL